MLFRRRNQAGSAKGPVVETNPNIGGSASTEEPTEWEKAGSTNEGSVSSTSNYPTKSYDQNPTHQQLESWHDVKGTLWTRADEKSPWEHRGDTRLNYRGGVVLHQGLSDQKYKTEGYNEKLGLNREVHEPRNVEFRPDEADLDAKRKRTQQARMNESNYTDRSQIHG